MIYSINPSFGISRAGKVPITEPKLMSVALLDERKTRYFPRGVTTICASSTPKTVMAGFPPPPPPPPVPGANGSVVIIRQLLK